MSLRCLLFSSNEEMVRPICQVLADLGIEAEYCPSAVDAVEKVTTQLFQIVITDWQDQPEATFLLKTARDLKASQRPLTLAIVSEEARPEALKIGANSVLLKPIRAEQVRDTMSTACELLRAKLQPNVGAPYEQGAAVMAAAASSGAVSMPASVTQAPEKIRAGEFLQSSSNAPSTQFDTEKEKEDYASDQHSPQEEALSELEPTAAAVEAFSEERPKEDRPTEERPKSEETLTGWAALQARLVKSAPSQIAKKPENGESLSPADTKNHLGPSAATAGEVGLESGKNESPEEPGPEATLFAYMADGSKEISKPPASPGRSGKIFLAGALVVCCVAVGAVPRSRQGLQKVFQGTVRLGNRWLNPPPPALPQPVAQHDSFGQSGDEYKLPVPGNIPDASTDPDQIRVLPVIDPTAKPDKGALANGQNSQSAQPVTVDPFTDRSQPAPTPSVPGPVGGTSENDSAKNAGEVPRDAAEAASNPASQTPAQANIPVPQATEVPQANTPAPSQAPAQVQNPVQTHRPPVTTHMGIPSSLRSQIASSTPEASGAKPVEAAMSSIEPVSLPESAVRELLAQSVDPEYPAGAKASGQPGSVVLQVLIGRDGTVQDAKFLQGSLVFARAASIAVKQWRFKPYFMNGRAVSVQSVVTLNFKPTP